MAMDDYNATDLINEKALIFVCATTGQGDEPENMKHFWRFLLRKSLPRDSLQGVNIAVLSLGDSSYQKFNWVGKRLSKRLVQLGAKEILPIGLCDDQHDLGIAAVYVPFIRDCFQKLMELYPIEQMGEVRQFKWKVKVTQEKPENEQVFEHLPQAKVLKVLENTRTTSESHFQDVRLIKLDSKGLNWEPGDICVIRGQNSDEAVAKLFDIFEEYKLNLKPEDIVEIEAFDEGKNIFIFNLFNF